MYVAEISFVKMKYGFRVDGITYNKLWGRQGAVKKKMEWNIEGLWA